MAAIAWQHLSEITKSKVTTILGNGPDSLAPSFVFASLWPDQMRKSDQDHPLWHFENIPFPIDGSETQPPEGENAETALDFLIFTEHPGISEAKRIAWIEHLIGDVHQPLHAVALFEKPYFPNGDRGGNLFPLDASIFSGTEVPSNQYELHHYWDFIFSINRLGSEAEYQPLVDAVGGLEVQDVPPFPKDEVNGRTTIRQWLQESEKLAETQVYLSNGPGSAPLIPGGKLPDGYAVRSLDLAKHQIKLAGLRLASVLESLYGD